MTVELDSPYVLLHDKKIDNLRDRQPALEYVDEADKPLLIVAEQGEGEALATLGCDAIRGMDF